MQRHLVAPFGKLSPIESRDAISERNLGSQTPPIALHLGAEDED